MLCVDGCDGFVRQRQAAFRHRAWRDFEHALDPLGATM
jgi:hypothetical protein